MAHILRSLVRGGKTAPRMTCEAELRGLLRTPPCQSPEPSRGCSEGVPNIDQYPRSRSQNITMLPQSEARMNDIVIRRPAEKNNRLNKAQTPRSLPLACVALPSPRHARTHAEPSPRPVASVALCRIFRKDRWRLQQHAWCEYESALTEAILSCVANADNPRFTKVCIIIRMPRSPV